VTLEAVQNRQRDNLPEGLEYLRVLLVGCGTLGSMAYTTASRTGIGAEGGWVLVDYDHVGPENMIQSFFPTQIDMPKVTALADLFSWMNTEPLHMDLEEFVESERGQFDVVICAVDDWEARRMLASLCQNGSLPTSLFFDGRIGHRNMEIRWVLNTQAH